MGIRADTTAVLERLAAPVVLAPMAGGPGTPELAAAVSQAGGLGFVAAGYRTAAQLADDVERTRALTSAPFGVNVFLVRDARVDEAAVAAYVAGLAPEAQRLGVRVGEPRFDDDEVDAKLALLATLGVPVVSFTFACPTPAQVEALHAAGSEVWVTVTSVAEAQAAGTAGADALVAQGVEAGGHRGSFADDDLADERLPTLDLVAALRAHGALPVVAAGGIATADHTAAALTAGAAAVQVGTAFLLADEAGTHPVHRAAVASDTPTALTRAFTGRTARGVLNRFVREHPDAPAGYPQIYHATAPLRTAARLAGDGDAVSLWAGTRHAAARPGPAADVVRALTP